MIKDLESKGKTLGVVGLGYVGLPIALEFARKYKVVGFDINASRVDQMRKGIDPSGELPSLAFDGTDILFSSNLEDLKSCSFYVVAVPTPINNHKLPDLNPLYKASETVGKVLSKGDYVVYESTVYPGCTEEECVPILENFSGLKAGADFKVGYSPERINPGDQEHTLTRIVKVAAGMDEESSHVIADVYRSIIKAGVHRSSSIKVAEAAKVIENTQRDLNIALMNELSMIFDRMGINTNEVLEAAGTKWNFLKFSPGLVGGHCIGVDPYYLTYKAQELGFFPKVILSGRDTNDGMGAYLAKRTIQLMVGEKIDISEAKILILGTTFKENVEDIRNSKVVDVVKELKSFSIDVDVMDPHANPEEVKKEYGYDLIEEPNGPYDALILAVIHDEYRALEEDDFASLLHEKGIFIDVKGAFSGKISKRKYWGL